MCTSVIFYLKTSYRIESIVPVAMETQLSNHEYDPIARLNKMANAAVYASTLVV